MHPYAPRGSTPRVTLGADRATRRAPCRARSVQRPRSDLVTDGIHAHPVAALVYLFFVFLPLFFQPRWTWTPFAASLLAIALFLPLHFAFARGQGRGRALMPLATAAIGYALIPFNSGGNTFLIYAMAMAALAYAPARAIAVSSLLLVLMGIEFWWVMPSAAFALGSTGIVGVIGAMVLFGTLFDRNRARRDAELRLTQDEVRRLAALAERERIGRDLHDLLGHTLSVVALKSELAGKLVERDPAAAKRQIGDVEQVARQALAQVREAVAGIRASGLQAELAAARLTLLTAEVSLDQQLAAIDLDPPGEHALALVLREAVTNILRHAGATRVDVELRDDGSRVTLSIADDGRGGADLRGHGLAGMRERLTALGGALEIDSPAGGGTRLLAHVPRQPSGALPAPVLAGGAR